MSNPMLCYIIPICGLRIKMRFDRDGMSDPTDYGGPRQYEIQNLSEINGITEMATEHNINIDDDPYIKGTMSPLDKIYMPPHQRKVAGIPQKAKYLAFGHPPPRLMDIFGNCEEIVREMVKRKKQQSTRTQLDKSQRSSKWQKFSSFMQSERSLRDSDVEQTDMCKVTAALFAVFGAFFYFSNDMNLIGINVVALSETEKMMRLAGPFEVSTQASKEMINAGRLVENIHPQHNECGIIRMGWIRPKETFEGYPASPKIPCKYGAFIFYKDNGESFIYAIRSNKNDLEEYLLSGSDFISDANECLSRQRKFTFSSNHPRLDDFKLCKKRVTSALKDCEEDEDEDSIDLEKMDRLDVQGTFPILHQAIKCRFDFRDIKKIVHKYGELHKTDIYGWQAIHYAVRFYADNDKVIEYLLENSDDDVLMQTDSLGRYPLHIACDSKPSERVIKLLIDKGKSGDAILYKKTKHLELLPIHVACNARASKEVIRALLDADKIGVTVRAKTAVGRLPLHIALFDSMPYDIIEMLLDAEHDSGSSDLKPEGIYQWDHGMLPIHIACLNGLDSEILKLLVHRDASGESLFAKLEKRNEFEIAESKPSSVSFAQDALIQNCDRGMVFDDNDEKYRYLEADTAFLSGMRSLHVCLMTKSTESCRVLLQAEKQHSHQGGASRRTRQKRAEMCDEMNKRTCLHLACMNNCETDIIGLLLVLDPYRSATRMQDGTRCTPLHLACNHKAAKLETIEALLNTEILNQGDENNSNERILGFSIIALSRRSVQEGEKRIFGFTKADPQPSETLDKLGRNPLSLAVKSCVSTDVLELMLQPEHFDMNGFDDRAIGELATRIKKNTKLQKLLNMTLAARIPFFIFFVQGVAYILSVIVTIEGISSRYLKEHPKEEWLVGLLSLSAIVFFTREIIQIRSENWNYFFDAQNVLELSNLVLFIMSIDIFNKDDINREKASTSYVLQWSISLLIINFIFFLRSTILPFSRFTGGLIRIFYTLVPFFAVSMLLLMMFTFIYRIEAVYDTLIQTGNATDAIVAMNLEERFLKANGGETTDTLTGECKTDNWECFKAVLNSFYGAGLSSLSSSVDILFGLIVMLVLLNVVIAIVSDAWEDAKDQATDVYWRGRLNFLMESRSAIKLNARQTKSWLSWLDNMPLISFKSSTISWTRDEPYCQVKTKKQYDNPKEYFPTEIAQQITAVKCPSTDFRWLKIRQDGEDKRVAYVLTSFKWFCCGLLNLFFLILGLVTCGVFWSTDQREWMFSFGNQEEGLQEEEDNDDKDKELNMLRERNKDLQLALEQVKEKMSKVENLMCKDSME